MTDLYSSNISTDILLSMIIDQSVALLNAPAAILALHDGTNGTMVVRAARGPWDVLVDTRLPPEVGKGRYVLSTGKPTAWSANDPGFVWFGMTDRKTSILAVPLITQKLTVGILWVARDTPFTTSEMHMISCTTAVAARALAPAILTGWQMSVQMHEDAHMCDKVVEIWTTLLALRDRGTDYHSQQATHLFMRLARHVGMSEAELVHARRGALLHDIGKLAIPDSILFKPGPLNGDEWEIMRQHPVYALQMLSSIPSLKAAIDIPYAHHEHWDGTGYPRGLVGENIPLAARIFMIIDEWDALLSDRPYRKAWPEEEVRLYVQTQAGHHFDPYIVQAFWNLLSEADDYATERSYYRMV